MTSTGFEIRLLCAPVENADALARQLAAFMAGVVMLDPSYVSHSEYFYGMSPDGQVWAEDLEARYIAELLPYLKSADGDDVRILVAETPEKELVGISIASIHNNGHETYWTIEDLAVAPAARRSGLGAAFVEEFADLARKDGAQRLVLESGVDNHGAHSLFEHSGFRPFSKTYMRDL